MGNIMELSVTGHVVKWAIQATLSGGVSLTKAKCDVDSRKVLTPMS